MPSVPKAVSTGARQRSSDGQTSATCSGSVPLAQQVEHLFADELERAAHARALEEADRTLELG